MEQRSFVSNDIIKQCRGFEVKMVIKERFLGENYRNTIAFHILCILFLEQENDNYKTWETIHETASSIFGHQKMKKS